MRMGQVKKFVTNAMKYFEPKIDTSLTLHSLCSCLLVFNEEIPIARDKVLVTPCILGT